MSKKVIFEKRRNAIVNELNKGRTLISVANEFGVTKQRIAGIAKDFGIQRRKDGQKRKFDLFNAFILDIKDNMSLDEIAEKHSISRVELKDIYKYVTGDNLACNLRVKRNKEISTKFLRGKTATNIIVDTSPALKNPLKIKCRNSIYSINTANGVKRYPQIGDRRKGGTFQNKKAINLIVKRRDKGDTFTEIQKELTKRGYKTVTGLDFRIETICQLYKYTKNKSVK